MASLAGLAQRVSCGVASTSPRCYQQQLQHATRLPATLRPPCSRQQLAPLQLQPLAAGRCGRAAAAITNMAAVLPGDSSSSGGRAAEPAAAGGGTVPDVLHGVWDWLCSRKPPKSLWRTIAALVLGGEALVRILQGAWPLPVGVGTGMVPAGWPAVLHAAQLGCCLPC